MKLLKTIQVLCWITTVLLLALGLYKRDLINSEQREIYLGLLGCFSVASIGLSQYIEDKKEKFSAANVISLGYITNCIRPIMDEQVKAFNGSQGRVKPRNIYIFIPGTIEEVENETVNKLLVNAGLVCDKVNVEVSTRNRKTVDIGRIEKSDHSDFFYFDIPNTITSLKKVLEYRLERKKNSFSQQQKIKLEKEYIEIFKEETESLLKKFELASNVKIVRSITELPV